MVVFVISEVIAALFLLFLGITSLFMPWVPARLAERAPDFGWEMRTAGVVLTLVALALCYEVMQQVMGVLHPF